MSTVELIVAFALSIWVIFTCFNQCTIDPMKRLVNWDKVGVLPGYSFFAPLPGRYDYHLLVRYETQRQELSLWREIGPENRRALISPIFNPNKRLKKALLDITTQLARLRREIGVDLKQSSVTYPYLVLLLVAEQAVRERLISNEPARYQFLVLVSSGYLQKEMTPLLLSPFHTMGDFE